MVECGGCRVKNFIPGDLAPMQTVPCTKCGHPVMVPVKLRQFELRSVIASGGMGTVFRAFDLNLHREVAVKLVKPEMASDPQIMESFFREARSGAALNHTNIIHIYNFDSSDGQTYLVMEIADCGSLESWIQRDERVPELNVLDVGIKIASALNKALQHNLLHRDIKPDNILYNSEGEPKLSDFGLAGTDAALDDDSFVMGTPEYIAPEKINRQGETFLSDMYSLGATLYHALTGRIAFDAPTQEERAFAHTREALTPPKEIVPDISDATNDAIVRCMAKNPAERFQSYEEMQMALEIARSHLLIRQSQEQGDEAAGKGGWWRR
jgi:serine/threonine protein kinase